MVQYVMPRSGAHAEAMGIKYVDGIVDVVIVKKSKPPYTVVGYGQGYTYNPKNIRFARNIKTYVADITGSDSDYTVHAISPAIAKMLVKTYLREGVRFKIYERKTSYRRG